MSRKFNTFKELIDFRKTCPICQAVANFEVKTVSITNLLAYDHNVRNKKESLKFNPNESNIIHFKEKDVLIDFNKNIATFKSQDSIFDYFDIKITCNQENHTYEAFGEFSFNITQDEELMNEVLQNANFFKAVNDLYEININDIKLNYELYTLLNYDNDTIYQIKLINDYNINKTSFDIAEMKLDGEQKSFKEKRIDLVEDNFFKLNDINKIYNKINTIFLLDDK